MPRPIEDPFEAAELKAKMEQKKMKEARKRREKAQKDGFISQSIQFKEDAQPTGEQDEDDDEMLDYGSYGGEDSADLCYDSEEEAEAEAAFRKEMREIKAHGKTVGEVQEFNPDYDVDKQTKLIQKFKAADGVSFVEYDEFGLQKKDGLGQFITTDNTVADFTIDAPKEMVEKAFARPTGVFRDFDKEKKDMDDDGKSLPESLTHFCRRKGSLRLPSRLRPRLRALGRAGRRFRQKR